MRRIVVGALVVAMAMAIVGFSVSADGGPYTRWLLSGSNIYSDPDEMADIIATTAATVPVSVTIRYGWAEIYEPFELVGGYVPTSQLLREEPREAKEERERSAMAGRRVGDMTYEELSVLLRQLLNGSIATPATPDAFITSVPAVTRVRTHTVMSGESLSSIAPKYGISWQALAAANGLTSPWRIEVGQILTIPTADAAAMPAVVSAASAVSSVLDPAPRHAVRLIQGQTLIPEWGYGPWAPEGKLVPKVPPSGSLPIGLSQPVTDFDGRNWQDHGQWSYVLPAGARECWVTIQGDAPASISWVGNTLTLSSSADITSKAKPAVDNAPMPPSGSSGISAVVYVR